MHATTGGIHHLRHPLHSNVDRIPVPGEEGTWPLFECGEVATAAPGGEREAES